MAEKWTQFLYVTLVAWFKNEIFYTSSVQIHCKPRQQSSSTVENQCFFSWNLYWKIKSILKDHLWNESCNSWCWVFLSTANQALAPPHSVLSSIVWITWESKSSWYNIKKIPEAKIGPKFLPGNFAPHALRQDPRPGPGNPQTSVHTWRADKPSLTHRTNLVANK